jgi:hypothetical protein
MKLMNIEALMYIFLVSDLMEEGGTMTVFYQNNTQQMWCVLFLLLHNRCPCVVFVSVDLATIGVWVPCPLSELYFFFALNLSLCSFHVTELSYTHIAVSSPAHWE